MRILQDSQLTTVVTNPRFVMRELMRRGARVDILDALRVLWTAEFGGRVEFLNDVLPLKVPHTALLFFRNKQITRGLLKNAGIAVAMGRSFTFDDKLNALAYAESLGYPVVVKPTEGIQGEGVYTELANRTDVEDAFFRIERDFGQLYHDVVVEKHFVGTEYRVFVDEAGHFAVTKREPACVIGDGKRSIKDLAELESARRLNPRVNCLCEIPVDDVAVKYLKKQGKTLSDVPAKGEKIYLRSNSNLKTGGTASDATDLAHPSVIEIGRKVLQATQGLPFVGIDFMTKDVTVEQTPESYVIIEVNPLPSIGMHLAPGEGASRPVDKWLADLIFPETKGL